jgi:hypothetical protein
MNEPVQRSARVRTINTKPPGKATAPRVRIKPCAFSAYQVDELMESADAPAKDSRQPAESPEGSENCSSDC